MKLTISLLILVMVLSLVKLKAQPEEPEIVPSINLAGPRFGVTHIADGEATKKLKDDFNASPTITQFGWQFETRFFTLDSGTSGLIEGIVLVGGLEQQLFLPSITGIVGLRAANGFELGFGPNVSLTGASFAFAIGVNFRSGQLNFPVNIAYVPSSKGNRVSLLIGFNARKR